MFYQHSSNQQQTYERIDVVYVGFKNRPCNDGFTCSCVTTLWRGSCLMWKQFSLCAETQPKGSYTTKSKRDYDCGALPIIAGHRNRGWLFTSQLGYLVWECIWVKSSNSNKYHHIWWPPDLRRCLSTLRCFFLGSLLDPSKHRLPKTTPQLSHYHTVVRITLGLITGQQRGHCKPNTNTPAINLISENGRNPLLKHAALLMRPQVYLWWKASTSVCCYQLFQMSVG